MLDGQAAGAHAAVVHAALAVGRVVPAPPGEAAAGTRRVPKISAAARGRQRDEAGRLGMQPPPPMRRAVHLDRALVDGEVADRAPVLLGQRARGDQWKVAMEFLGDRALPQVSSSIVI